MSVSTVLWVSALVAGLVTLVQLLAGAPARRPSPADLTDDRHAPSTGSSDELVVSTPRPASASGHAAVGDGRRVGGEVGLDLVGVGTAKSRIALSNFVARAEVGGDRDGVAGAGVRAGQRAAAQQWRSPSSVERVKVVGSGENFMSRSCRT